MIMKLAVLAIQESVCLKRVRIHAVSISLSCIDYTTTATMRNIAALLRGFQMPNPIEFMCMGVLVWILAKELHSRYRWYKLFNDGQEAPF